MAEKNPFYTDGIHFNKRIERVILGICLFDASGADIVSGMIQPKHFYVSDNKLVYEAIMAVHSRGVPTDTFSVMHEIMKDGLLTIGGNNVAFHLTSLMNEITSVVSLTNYAYILVNLWKHRRVIELTSRNHTTGENPVEVLEEIEKTVAEIRQSSAVSYIDAPGMIMKLYEHQERVSGRSLLGITTGYQSMDNFMSGFEDGGLYVIAARPSVGKTAFMGSCVLGAAKAGKHVGIVQLEMGIQQTAARLASLYSGIDYSEIVEGVKKDEEERDRFYRVMGGLSGLNININPHGNLTLEAIKSWAHSMKHAGKLDILFVDYLQLIEINGSRSREQDVSAISRGLKTLARVLNIPIVALSQLNRAIENRASKKPILSDLRESGAIEQDADMVMFLHRDWVMGILADEAGNSTEKQAELIVAKHRNGARGMIPFRYDGTKMKFYEPDWFDNRP